jgi:uncharacterized Fe-S cluster-containing MiaB family protein
MTPFQYIADALDVPKNCNRCTEKILQRIFRDYNTDFEVSRFTDIHCDCKSIWMNQITNESAIHPLENRALDMLEALEMKND